MCVMTKTASATGSRITCVAYQRLSVSARKSGAPKLLALAP